MADVLRVVDREGPVARAVRVLPQIALAEPAGTLSDPGVPHADLEGLAVRGDARAELQHGGLVAAFEVETEQATFGARRAKEQGSRSV